MGPSSGRATAPLTGGSPVCAGSIPGCHAGAPKAGNPSNLVDDAVQAIARQFLVVDADQRDPHRAADLRFLRSALNSFRFTGLARVVNRAVHFDPEPMFGEVEIQCVE